MCVAPPSKEARRDHAGITAQVEEPVVSEGHVAGFVRSEDGSSLDGREHGSVVSKLVESQ